jgi:hypothetical protein
VTHQLERTVGLAAEPQDLHTDPLPALDSLWAVLEVKFELSTELDSYRIEESSEIRSSSVVLHIPRIEVVGRIEHLDLRPENMSLSEDLDVESPVHLKVQGGKSWEALAVALPNEI